ncbi:hypothetical protein [Streptomyces gossypii]|uniref:hypothetical protein n=1 Tax=Streptomyces gossypii TaxID=2883101 RepID=UPI00288303E9|nr:hypothetical protein [Streptomyces gossypii]
MIGEELGLSRTIFREAVRALAGKGMIQAAPNFGTVVAPYSSWSLLDRDVSPFCGGLSFRRQPTPTAYFIGSCSTRATAA